MRRVLVMPGRVVAASVTAFLVVAGCGVTGASATTPTTSSTRCGDSGTPAVVALQDSHFYIDTASTALLYSSFAGYTVRASVPPEAICGSGTATSPGA